MDTAQPTTNRRDDLATPHGMAEHVLRALQGRGVWDAKQQLYYEMRHDGVRRQNKPFPKAADFHLALVDVSVRKQKSFWHGQCFQNDRVAKFVARRSQAEYMTTGAAEFYDYTIRNETDLVQEFVRVVDTMLLRGRGVLKAWVDGTDANRLRFESIETQHIIMAPGANDFDDADWFVHVKHPSRGQYERDPRYQTVPWERIQGGEAAMSNLNRYWIDKIVREGLTHTANTYTAVIWECWIQEAPGQWRVRFISPQCPDAELRPSFLCPYKGADGKTSMPFFSFCMELKDAGWYSPRGLGELLGAYEMLACKAVNEWLDGITFASRPLFTAEAQLPSAASIKFAPGEIIPGNVKRVDMGAGNLDLPNVIGFVQTTSEQAAQMPDFGIAGKDGKDNRTATEIERISQVMDVGTSFNGDMVRRVMSRVHRHCWALLLQYRPKELSYLLADEVKTLPDEALHDAYAIQVGGRSDQWNQAQVFQRCAARYQLLAADPNVSHEELVRSLLTADDPDAARTLFVASDDKAASEAEDEAREICVLSEGFPATVRPNEDHQTRIHVLAGWLQKQHLTGAPVDPIAQQRVSEHLAMHVNFLKQANPEAGAQAVASLQQLMAQHAPEPTPGVLNPQAEAPTLPPTNPTETLTT